jgi:uncharacterized membrane-anchored protein
MARAARRTTPDPTVDGPARVDRRTKDLVKRLLPGEIAVIDHADLDRVAADALVEAGVVAVVNAAPSITGRYPNGGPIALVEAGVVLLDDCGHELLERVVEGDLLHLDGNEVWHGDELVAKGERLDATVIRERMEEARAAIGVELERFAENTLEYIRREARQTFEPVELPPLHTDFKGRHALVVVRGFDYKHDLKALRAYIREYRPVLIAVDGGADALIDSGRTPEIIIGDFDSLSPVAMHCGADLVHHVHPDGRAPGRENLEIAGVHFETFVTEGTSEDAAMLLAYEAGAELIVAVGTHATMVEFLDKGRRGMASTFLTRLRLGPMLVDAKGVSNLYRGRVRRRDLLLLVVSAVAAMVAMVSASHSLQVFFEGFQLMWHRFWDHATSWL